ncbi:HAD hydrolase family protein, partial [Escherichia coli]|nr:HAD hydrolase family protein [Escherichia coli]
ASGGFTYFSDYIKDKVDLDFARSNQLEIIDGKLTGKVLGDVVTAQMKSDILVELADEYEIEQHNTVAVGDGANDLVMMSVAGLGI